MSVDTRAALDAALAAHVADETEGAIVTGFVTVISYMHMERADGTSYWMISPEGQSLHADLGLIRCAELASEDRWRTPSGSED